MNNFGIKPSARIRIVYQNYPGKRFLLRILLLAVGFILFIAATYSKKPVIWILGDSTACKVPPSESKPPLYLMGWAQMLPPFFDSTKVEIQNKAVPGQSSRSFFRENWSAFKDKIQKDDYLIIQFGHNDPKANRDRLTVPGSTFEQFLMEYISHAKKVGAIPILATPIERNRWKSNKELFTTHGKYPDAMRNLAKKENVALVDMTRLTNDFFVKSGRRATIDTIFYPGSSAHVQKRGAIAISRLFADDIARQKIMPMCSWLRNAPVPTLRPFSDTNHLKKTNGDTFFYLSAGKVLFFDANSEKNLKISIISLNGKTVLSQKFGPFEAENIGIPLYGLGIGTYLVKSESDGIPKVGFINIVY